jgi:hypothetical protein
VTRYGSITTEDTMRQTRAPGPLTQIAIGLGVSTALFCTVGTPGCGSNKLPALPPELQEGAELATCNLDALRVLPKDLNQVTVGDARDLVKRLMACRGQGGDAGAP